MEYSQLADLVGVKIDESDDEPSQIESPGPSSGMISARRRAQEEIRNAVIEQVKLSQEQKEKILSEKERVEREAAELKKSIEDAKKKMEASGSRPGTAEAVRTSNQNPMKQAEPEDEYEYEEY